MIIEQAAELIAKGVHYNQIRRGGADYITHPARVVERIKSVTNDPSCLAAGWLHDVLEHGMNESDLRQSLSVYHPEVVDEVCGAVVALTRDPNETYGAYINRVIEAGSVALEVKIADIVDNISDAPSDGQIEKYHHALRSLIVSR